MTQKKEKRKLIANLPSGVGVTRIKDGEKVYFRVRLGKRFTGGPIHLKAFRKLNLAEKWIKGDAKAEQASGGIIQFRAQAGHNAFDGDLKSIAESQAALRLCREAKISLIAAVQYALKHMKAGKDAKTFAEATAFLINHKRSRGVTPKHLSVLKGILERVGEDYGKRGVHSITQEELEEWLAEQDDVSSNTRISYARHIHILFSEAVAREWCATNPAKNLKRNSDTTGDVEVWTPDQMRRFMAAAIEHEPKIVPGLAIKAWAGVRTSELFALDWKRISDKKIQILGKTAKTRRSRGIPVQDNLAAWLKPYRKTEGPVVAMTDTEWFDALQRVAAISAVPLLRNVLRHSFGTYRYYQSKSEPETAYEMGNSPDVIQKHYRAVAVDDSDVEGWWAIMPT